MTGRPDRIQLKRSRGWRMPEGAVKVDRSTIWGNPFCASCDWVGSRERAVELFAQHLRVRANPWPGWADYLDYPSDEQIRYDLAGKSLACWCPLPAEGEPDICHAAVLLRVAAGEVP